MSNKDQAILLNAIISLALGFFIIVSIKLNVYSFPINLITTIFLAMMIIGILGNCILSDPKKASSFEIEIYSVIFVGLFTSLLATYFLGQVQIHSKEMWLLFGLLFLYALLMLIKHKNKDDK